MNDKKRQVKKKPLHKKFVFRRLFLLLVSALLVVGIAWTARLAYTKINVGELDPAPEIKLDENRAVPTNSGEIHGPPLGASFLEEKALHDAPENPYGWELILVNPSAALPQDFEVELERVHENMFLDKRVADDFKHMVVEAKESGISLELVSAYMDPSDQEELFNEEVSRLIASGMLPDDAHEKAIKTISPPWHSEHHTGLSVDLSTLDCEMTEDFDKTLAYKWLEENSWNYGFILRYQMGKEDITQRDYQPFHFRYVGTDAAKVIYKNGYCLEEYLDAKALGMGDIIISELQSDEEVSDIDEKIDEESSQ